MEMFLAVVDRTAHERWSPLVKRLCTGQLVSNSLTEFRIRVQTSTLTQSSLECVVHLDKSILFLGQIRMAPSERQKIPNYSQKCSSNSNLAFVMALKTIQVFLLPSSALSTLVHASSLRDLIISLPFAQAFSGSRSMLFSMDCCPVHKF